MSTKNQNEKGFMKKRVLPYITTYCSVFLVFAATNSRACGTSSSNITNLFDASGDTFQVSALSSSGQVTGYFYGSQSPHAFLYGNGAVTDLGAPGGNFSEGIGINKFGDVVGGGSLADFEFHALLFHAGNLVDLGTLGGSYSTAAYINDAGVIVGNASTTGDGSTLAFLYTNQ